MSPSIFNFTKEDAERDEEKSESAETPCNDSAVVPYRMGVRFLLNSVDSDSDSDSEEEEEESTYLAPKKAATQEQSLEYFGLAPKNKPAEEVNNEDDTQFLKPAIYNCDRCCSFYLNKKYFRRHVTRHLSNYYWCLKCNEAFDSVIKKRRHQLMCWRR